MFIYLQLNFFYLLYDIHILLKKRYIINANKILILYIFKKYKYK